MMQSSPDTKHGTRLVSQQFCTEVYAKKKKNALFVDFNFIVSFIYSPVLFLPTKLNITINGLCGKVLLLCLIITKTMFSVFGANSNFGVIEHTQTLMGDQGDVETGTARLMME